MNSKLGSNKFSTAEKSMNKVILVYIGILIAEVILCSGLRYGYGFDLQYDSFKEGTEIVDHWYLGNYWPRNAINVLQDIFSFLVIFNNIVPISLYVTLEVQKFVGMIVIVVSRSGNRLARSSQLDVFHKNLWYKCGHKRQINQKYSSSSFIFIYFNKLISVLFFLPILVRIRGFPGQK